MKISTRQLRQIIREELVREFGEQTQQGSTSPNVPPGFAPQRTAPSGMNLRAQGIVKVLAARGEPVELPAVLAWLKQQNPQVVSSTAVEQLADNFYRSGKVGVPSSTGDFGAEQAAKAKQQALFDKYSSPRK
jgi:hypothetical protein